MTNPQLSNFAGGSYLFSRTFFCPYLDTSAINQNAILSLSFVNIICAECSIILNFINPSNLLCLVNLFFLLFYFSWFCLTELMPIFSFPSRCNFAQDFTKTRLRILRSSRPLTRVSMAVMAFTANG